MRPVRPITLRNAMVLIVIAALLPIGLLSVSQAVSTLNYSRTLISNGLVTSALAIAARERDPFTISKQILERVSLEKSVIAGNAGCRDSLKTALGYNPALINMARSDAKGRVLCSILPFDPATNFSTETWWQQGIKARKITISAPIYGPISKKRALIAMLPVTAKGGSNNGAITIAIDASWLKTSIAETELSPGAVAAIVNQLGEVVLSNDEQTLPQVDVKTGRSKAAAATARDGVSWTYAVAPLYERELYVVYAEPSEQLMANAVKQVRINLLLPIAALLIASLAIWLGTNKLVLRWLESLRLLADQFAKSDYSSKAEAFASAPRELLVLSDHLHGMARAIETRDTALQAALDAKTVLTHDIHHRVKNNLQIVSSLLTLQAGKIIDPAAREALGQTRARIGALAQIHRLLHEESHDSDHGKVNIASLLNALCIQLRALHREQSNIHLACDAALQTVPINDAVPLTLLAVEAITNAYRHGFASGDSGSITVHFVVVEDQATLCITDYGRGYDPAQTTDSMGGQLMEAFAQQLGGVLKIDAKMGIGTTVSLTYPLQYNVSSLTHLS